MAASSRWAMPASMSWAASALVVPGVAGADDSDGVEPLPHADAEMNSAPAAAPRSPRRHCIVAIHLLIRQSMVEMCQPEVTLIGATCVRSKMTRAGPPQARPFLEIVVAFRRCRMLSRPAGQNRRHTEIDSHSAWTSPRVLSEEHRCGWVPALLQREQSAFTVQAAAVSGEAAVRTDHPMARHDDADRIVAVGQTDGSKGSG